MGFGIKSTFKRHTNIHLRKHQKNSVNLFIDWITASDDPRKYRLEKIECEVCFKKFDKYNLENHKLTHLREFIP